MSSLSGSLKGCRRPRYVNRQRECFRPPGDLATADLQFQRRCWDRVFHWQSCLVYPGWTLDGWRTIQDSPSVDTGLGIHYFDICVPNRQRGPVRFTFFWLESREWEGRDYQVGVHA